MKVKDLIRALRKMPANARVAVCAHDQDPDEGELDGCPKWVAEAPQALIDRGYEVVIGL